MSWSVRYRTKACAVSNRTQKLKLLLEFPGPNTKGLKAEAMKQPILASQFNKTAVLSLMFVAAQTGAPRQGILESDAETVALQP